MQKHPRPVLIESMENRVLFDVSLLTETIVSSTLPTVTSDQAVVKGTMVVDVTNSSGVDVKEKAVVGVVISNGTLVPVAGSFSPLKSKALLLSVKSGQTKTFNFAINIGKGKFNDGVDTITALVVNPFGAHSQSPSGPTLTVHPPVVTLSATETFVKLTDDVVAGSKAKPTDKVVITNTGSDQLTTPITVGVYATNDGIAADGTLVSGVTKTVKINPGKTAIVSIPLAGVPKLANGTYTLITQVKQTNGTIITTDPATAPTVTISAPNGGTTGPLFSDSITTATPAYEPDPLQGFLQTISSLTMDMVITNSGSITNGTEGFSLFASPSTTFDSSAVQVGGPLTLELGSIPTGGKRTFIIKFNVSPNFPGTQNSAGNTTDFIFVQVTDPAGNVTMASFPQAITFAGPIVG